MFDRMLPVPFLLHMLQGDPGIPSADAGLPHLTLFQSVNVMPTAGQGGAVH